MSKPKSLKTKPRVILIAAVGNDGAIGVGGKLPWRCPVDLRHFRDLTMGKVVLMGRKTAESLPRALDGRVNLVLTRDRSWVPPKDMHVVYTQGDINRHLRRNHADELWVIGGGDIYAKYIDQCDLIHLSVLDIDVPDADAWFPLEALGDFEGTYTQVTKDPKVTFWTLVRGGVPTQTHMPRDQVYSPLADWSSSMVEITTDDDE